MALGVEFRMVSYLRIRKSLLTVQVIHGCHQHYLIYGIRKSSSSGGLRMARRPKAYCGLSGEYRFIKTGTLWQRSGDGSWQSMQGGHGHQVDHLKEEGGKRQRKEESAPALTTPIERHLQTLAVLTYTLPSMISPLLSPLLFIYTLTTKLAPIAVGYAAWVYYDVQIKKTSSRGGRASDWVRRSRMWVHFKNYFPVSLVKTAELDPGKNYLFGYHPHGILVCGAFANFATEATDFSGVFPGIKPHRLVVKGCLWFPVVRSLLQSGGFCDSSRESMEWILTKQGTGNAAIITVGGAEEMLEANPGSYNIVLKRKGFVKMAIQTGACLVPVFSFGENDLFVQANNPHGSYLRSLQQAFEKIIGFTPPLLQTFALLPLRRPIHTVIGQPIEVEKVIDPDQSTIDHVHQQYMSALNELFDQHKVQYGVDKNITLNIM